MEIFHKNLIKNHLSLNINQSLNLQQQLKLLAQPLEELQLMALDLFENNPAIEEFHFDKPNGFQGDIQNIKQPYMEALLEQIPTKLLSTPQKILAEEIFQSFSKEGFLLKEEKEYLRQKYKDNFDEVLDLIKKVCLLGFENYVEYWIYYLNILGNHEKVVEFLNEFKEQLLKADFSYISKKLNLSFQQIQAKYLSILKTIPKCQTVFSTSLPSSNYIDLIIEPCGESLDYEVTDPLPFYKLNRMVYELSKDVNDFYKPYLDQIQQFTIGVNKRKTTLQKLAKYLCKIQKDYLCGHVDTPRAINPKDVAQDLSLHPSTLARCLQHKTLKCIHGIIPLKSLVTPSTLKEDKISLLQKLKNIISKEDKSHPYSDEQLLQILKAKGSKISRRTLTKYRHKLKIPDARRRFFR